MDPTVGWDRSPLVESWAGLPALAGTTYCDLCVVGLGASGLAAVRWAVEQGLSVVGLDAGRVAAGAAGRNGGFLLGGAARFHHQVVDQLGEALAVDIYRRTLTEIDRLADRLGGRVRRTGSLRLAGLPGPSATDDELRERTLEQADCRRHLAALQRAGVRAEWYDGPLGRGVHLLDDAVVNPAERCLLEATDLADRATLFENSPVRTVTAGASPQVTTADGTVSAQAVVVCVDGGLERVVPSLGSRVRSARLQMLATAPLSPIFRGAVYCRWGYDYAQQTADGRLLIGGGRDLHAEQEWTGDSSDSPRPTVAVQRYLDQLVLRFAPAGTATVVDRWAGLVAYTSDGLPICELVSENVAAAGAYSGTGNVVGPLVARAAAALAVGVPPVDWPLATR